MHYLFAFTGPSGAGKTSLAQACFRKDQKIITHTTRPPRTGEKDGVDYYFETPISFQRLIDNEALAEFDHYHHHLYGIAWQDILDHLAHDHGTAVLTVPGVQALARKLDKQLVTFFLELPLTVAEARMQARGDEPQQIAARLSTLLAEQQQVEQLAISQLYRIDASQPLSELIQTTKGIIQQYQ